MVLTATLAARVLVALAAVALLALVYQVVAVRAMEVATVFVVICAQKAAATCIFRIWGGTIIRTSAVAAQVSESVDNKATGYRYVLQRVQSTPSHCNI